MTVTCATRFTDSSFSAVKVAALLAGKRSEGLFLINVQRGDPSTAQGQQLEVAAHDTLKLQAIALAASGLEVGTAVLHGPIGRTVRQFCAERATQLVVVGDTHPLTHALLEGPLDQLAGGVEVPLLVVRDPAPLVAWLRDGQPLKVMLALDRSWTSAMARNWIRRLAEYGPLDLVAAHIWWPETEYAQRGLPTPPDGEGDWAVMEVIRRETESALLGLPANVTHRVRLQTGREHVAGELLELSVDEQVDVVVVGTHPTRGPLARLWSVSHDLLSLAPMSVVCVPGPRTRLSAASAVPGPARQEEQQLQQA